MWHLLTKSQVSLKPSQCLLATLPFEINTYQVFCHRDRHGETNIFKLPPEIVEDILKFLSFKDKKRLRLVSRSMYQIVTPLDHRFQLWNIDLNKPCPYFGQILNKRVETQLSITLPNSEDRIETFARHLVKVKNYTIFECRPQKSQLRFLNPKEYEPFHFTQSEKYFIP